MCIFQGISAHVKAQVVLPYLWWPKGTISSMIRCSMRAHEGLHRVKELADRPQSLLSPRHHSWVCWIILVFLLRVWYESYSKRFHFYYWKQILILNMNLKEFRLLNWSGTLWMLKSAPFYMPEEPKQKNWQEKETNSAHGMWGCVREWWISVAFHPLLLICKVFWLDFKSVLWICLTTCVSLVIILYSQLLLLDLSKKLPWKRAL